LNKYETDVIVIGGGPSGIVSAIAAARQGAGVILVEKGQFLGGTATSGMICEIDAPCKDGISILPSVGRELVQRLIDLNAAVYEENVPMTSNPAISCDRIRFNPEHMKLVLDEMVTSHNIRVFFSCMLKKVDSCPQGVCVTLTNQYSDVELTGKVLVDASGNSEAVYLLDEGCTIKTKPENLQPASLIFRLGGINPEEYSENLDPEKITRIILKGMDEGALPARILATFPIPGTAEAYIHATRCENIDFERIEDISDALIQARRQVVRIIPFIKENMKGCQNAYLSSIAASLGIRDRRKIHGLYELTGDDIVQCREFEDTVAIGAYPVDIHKKKGEYSVQFTRIEKDGIYNIPYRSFVMQKYGNVVASGKCVYADDIAFAAFRTMGSVMSIGNAAGLAAAIAANDNVDVKNIDLRKIRKILREVDYPDIADRFKDPEMA